MWDAFVAASLCRSRLREAGLEVTMTTDLDTVLESVSQLPKKEYFTPLLDPRKNDFSPDNYFWLIARSNGVAKIVGGGRLDTYQSDASDRIAKMYNRAFGASTLVSVDAMCSEVLAGRVAYLGDLHSEATRSMGRHVVSDFLGLANFLCAARFRADVTYSMFANKDFRRGSAAVNGFTDTVVNPFSWGEVPECLSASCVLAYRHHRKSDGYFRGIIQELEHIEPQLPIVHGPLKLEGRGGKIGRERVEAA